MKTLASKRTASYLLAALFCVVIINSCNHEESPTVVTISFASDFQTVTEGENARIYILLDHPAPIDAHIRLTIETNGIYGVSFETNPILKTTGESEILVEEAQEKVEVKLKTIDDSKFSGSRFAVFRITSATGGLKPGNITTHTVTIHDDEGPSIAFFQSAQSYLKEDSAAAQKVEIRLSAPAKGEGSIIVGLEPGKAVPGTHFNLDRELTENTFTVNVVEGDSAYNIEVSPVDNNDFNGDLELTFDILDVSGVVQMEDNLHHVLTIRDDELPSVVQFASTSGTIDEPSTTPHVIDLTLSSPVKGEGSLKIRIGKGAKYGIDFITTPEADSDFVVLDISRDQTDASFSVSMLDDDVIGGDLTIPFSIDHGTGPILPGTENQEYVLTVVDNEKPTVVEFSSSSMVVDEASSTGVDVEIVLSAPAPGPGEIVLEVLRHRDQVVSDPPIERIYESYGSYFYKITLDVPEGAESVSFHVDPINNSYCGRNVPLTFFIISVPNSLEVGSNNKLNLTLLEDEPHTTVKLFETEGVLMENATEAIKVELEASDPLPSPPTVMVYLDPYTYYYSGRFKIVPDFLEYSSSSSTYGYFDYEAGATSLSFEIVPINDFEKNGNFTEVFHFQVDNTRGHCLIAENGHFTLNFVDDD